MLLSQGYAVPFPTASSNCLTMGSESRASSRMLTSAAIDRREGIMCRSGLISRDNQPTGMPWAAIPAVMAVKNVVLPVFPGALKPVRVCGIRPPPKRRSSSAKPVLTPWNSSGFRSRSPALFSLSPKVLVPNSTPKIWEFPVLELKSEFDFPLSILPKPVSRIRGSYLGSREYAESIVEISLASKYPRGAVFSSHDSKTSRGIPCSFASIAALNNRPFQVPCSAPLARNSCVLRASFPKISAFPGRSGNIWL